MDIAPKRQTASLQRDRSEASQRMERAVLPLIQENISRSSSASTRNQASARTPPAVGITMRSGGSIRPLWPTLESR